MKTEVLASHPASSAARYKSASGLIDRLFFSHPRAVGESYRRHAGIALRFGGTLARSGAKCVVHAVFPSLFKTSASDCVRRLNAELERRRTVADDQDYVI